MAFQAAMVLAAMGLLLLAFSLFGLYRMYGHPALRYILRVVDLGGLRGEITVADLHIGTYRHAFLLSDALPEATVQTVDCWNVEGESPEEAVQDVRDLEVPPTSNPRIVPSKADHFTVPLPDASCDAVCFGFGTHEIPAGISCVPNPKQTASQEASGSGTVKWSALEGTIRGLLVGGTSRSRTSCTASSGDSPSTFQQSTV